MNTIILLVHNVRSCYNVGSIFRTAEGFGVKEIHLSGYSPYPKIPVSDLRPPHIAEKVDKQIHKTALGAEKLVNWSFSEDIIKTIAELKKSGVQIVSLEQNPKSISINKFRSNNDVALVVGNEISGIDSVVIDLSDDIIQIPMFGKKESFNVAQATAVAIYHLKFQDS